MDITGLYAYRIEELAVGIVKANSYEDARAKVKAAYLKHNNEYDPERDCIEFDGNWNTVIEQMKKLAMEVSE